MWLMTTEGFFSIVQKGHDPANKQGLDDLCVRARCREDLERLKKRYDLGALIKIHATKGTDYPFRMWVPREVLMGVLADAVYNVDYANFKDEVTKRRGRKHHDVFTRIWGALLSLEPPSVRRAWERTQQQQFDVGRGTTFK